jgi:hypothetical protein
MNHLVAAGRDPRPGYRRHPGPPRELAIRSRALTFLVEREQRLLPYDAIGIPASVGTADHRSAVGEKTDVLNVR